jgi:flagellum-specific ATP synthase
MNFTEKSRPAGANVRELRSRLAGARLVQNCGRVTQMIGLVIETDGPMASIGEICSIQQQGRGDGLLAEVVGFRDKKLLLMPLGEVHGICPGSEVVATGHSLRVPVGDELMGRVIDGMGHALDEEGEIPRLPLAELDLSAPHPLKRARIKHTFETGIKAIDTFVPIGRGQRLGIFSGSGVGKSTLMGMMASKAEADVNVIALIGERGREVREFLETDLDEAGRQKSVVIVATSNEPALMRVKGTFLAMTIAEYFRAQGRNVLLMMDSVTRFAMAQREIGLAIGEPPSSRGYPPSVFSLLPQLLERAGNSEHGSITGLFNVLVEADDMNDPIGDAARSVLDGHLVLSRELASHNHYPAIDVLSSVSRLAQDLLTDDEQALAGGARNTLATYRKNQDLISIGAYERGSDQAIDSAIQRHEPLNKFLKQDVKDTVARPDSWSQLKGLMGSAEQETLATAPVSPAAPVAQQPQQSAQAPMLSPGLASLNMAPQPAAPAVSPVGEGA